MPLEAPVIRALDRVMAVNLGWARWFSSRFPSLMSHAKFAASSGDVYAPPGFVIFRGPVAAFDPRHCRRQSRPLAGDHHLSVWHALCAPGTGGAVARARPETAGHRPAF